MGQGIHEEGDEKWRLLIELGKQDALLLQPVLMEYIKGVERVGLVDLLTCRATGDLVEAEGLGAEAVAAEEEASLDQCPQRDAADEVLVEEEGAREELREEKSEVKLILTVRSDLSLSDLNSRRPLQA
nr:unnamed protein product [Haemonchus contortus]